MDFRPVWWNTLFDSSMLISVTHTCRRLREVALTHPYLWTTSRLSFERLPLIQQMTTWSKHIPLNVVAHDIGVLSELSQNIRFESIHLHDIKESDLDLLSTVIDHTTSPALHSFSLLCHPSQRRPTGSKREPLPLHLEHAPNLRYLTLDEVEVLPNKGFPCLTHLALIDSTEYTIRNWFSQTEFHTRLFEFLKASPQLKSIILTELCLSSEGIDVPIEVPSPLPLAHLRHVTLCNLSVTATKHYVALLQPPVNGSSVHILGHSFTEPQFPELGRFLLPPDYTASQRPEQICVQFGVRPIAPDTRDYAISVATVSSRSTRHLITWSARVVAEQGGVTRPYGRPSTILSHWQHPSSLSPFLHVDEVWLYGISTIAPVEWPSGSLLHLPLAARVVVVTDRRLHYRYHDVPTLRLLPSVHDQLPGSIAITTLRLVHGFSEPGHDEEPSLFDPDPAVRYRLPLGQLVEDLRSGEYRYLKHLVLQATPHMHVDEEELDEVRDAGRFETFAFERIATFPEMPRHSDPALKEISPNMHWLRR